MPQKVIVPYLEAIFFDENNLQEVLDFMGLTQSEVNEDGNIEYMYDQPEPTVIEVGSWIIGHPLRGPGQVEAIDESQYQRRYVEIDV